MWEFVFTIARIENIFLNQFHRKIKQIYLIDDKKHRYTLETIFTGIVYGFIDTTVDVQV
jgi:hypothetical protein